MAVSALGIAGTATSVAHADSLPCLPTGSSGCDLAPGIAGLGPVIRPGDMIQTDDRICSVALIGHIGAARYAVTAGHCWKGEEGADVYDINDDHIGTFEAGVPDSDDGRFSLGYGLIRLDDDVKPSGAFANHLMESIDTNPYLGEQVCKLGWRTGLTCGVITGIFEHDITSTGISNHGDSGGVVFHPTIDGQAALIGLVFGHPDGSHVDIEPAADLLAGLQAYGHGQFSFYEN